MPTWLGSTGKAEAGGRCFCSSPHTAGTSEDGKVSSRHVARVAVCRPQTTGRDPAQPLTMSVWWPSQRRWKELPDRSIAELSEFIKNKSRDNVGTASTAGRALDPSGRADGMLSDRGPAQESRHFRELFSRLSRV